MSKIGQAGTLESNDIHVVVSEATPGSGIKVELISTVLLQYEPAIRQTIKDVCNSVHVVDVEITATDKGALDCTVRARVKTALQRAGMVREVLV